MFPPGRGRVATKPASTGPATFTNTTGIVRVSRWRAAVTGEECARITSARSPTNSFAKVRIRSTSPAVQRMSIRMLMPSVQPNSASPRTNAESCAFPAGSFSSNATSTPIRRMRSGCCAGATTGHTAALPKPAMNSRRRILALSRSSGAYRADGCKGTRASEPAIAAPHEAACGPTSDLRFLRQPDRSIRLSCRRRSWSASLEFDPQQTSPLFDHFVGADQQRIRHGQAECLGGLHVDDQIKPSSLLDR